MTGRSWHRTRWLRMLAYPLVLLAVQAEGGGLRGFHDSWLVEAADSWNLLGPGPRAVEIILQGRSTVSVGAGQGRLFSLPELEQFQLDGQVTCRFLDRTFRLEADWQQLGGDLYRESEIRLTGMLGRFPGFGVQVQRHTTNLLGRQIWSGLGLDLRVDYLQQVTKGTLLRLGLVLPLASPDSPAGQPRLRNFFLLSLIRDRVAVALQVDRRGDGTPVLGWEVFLGSPAGVGLNFRADPGTGSLGPGIQLRRGMLLLRTAHLVHPFLGQTHRFSLTVIHSHG